MILGGGGACLQGDDLHERGGEVGVVRKFAAKLSEQPGGPVELLTLTVDTHQASAERALGISLGLGFDERDGGVGGAGGAQSDILGLYQLEGSQAARSSPRSSAATARDSAVSVGGRLFSTAASIR